MFRSLNFQTSRIREGYSWRSLRGDALGGVATMVVALPIALALGVTVAASSGEDPGVGALAGVGCGRSGILYSGLRRYARPHVRPIGADDGGDDGSRQSVHLDGAFTVVALAGLIQITMGALRLGRFIAYTPFSVISGLVTGVGVIIVLLHVAPILGSGNAAGGRTRVVAAWPDLLRHINVEALALGMGTLLVGIFWPTRLRQFIASTLAALIVGSLIGVLWLTEAPIIGHLPSG